jgi:hypothetical protein
MSKIHTLRNLLIILCLLSNHFNMASQARTSLPYSIFGVGELNARGFSRNLGMGKSGIALSSGMYLNNLNPASYCNMDSISFFFDFGINSDFVNYKTSYARQKGNDINLKNVALGFRINRKWSSSFGIVPFSTVGYKIEFEKNLEGTNDMFSAQLTGSGGLNQFYWDNSYLLFKNFSLGVTASYLFGNIESKEVLQYEYFEKSIISTQTSRLTKLYLDFGVQYYFKIKDNMRLTLGGIFGNNHKLNFKEQIIISESDGTVYEDDTERKSSFNFPFYYGGGMAISYAGKFTFCADYLYQDWSLTESDDLNFKYIPSSTYRFGVEYYPNRANQFGYLGAIFYRAGFYHTGSYVEIDKTSFSDNGFTLGVGLPFFRNKSTININYITGTKGTLKNGLIHENYNSVMLSLTWHDWWFIKRKYD